MLPYPLCVPPRHFTATVIIYLPVWHRVFYVVPLQVPRRNVMIADIFPLNSCILKHRFTTAILFNVIGQKDMWYCKTYSTMYAPLPALSTLRYAATEPKDKISSLPHCIF